MDCKQWYSLLPYLGWEAVSSRAAQAPLQEHNFISSITVHGSQEVGWGSACSMYEPRGCRNPPVMLHACSQHGSGVCTAIPASVCLQASAAGAPPTCTAHGSWDSQVGRVSGSVVAAVLVVFVCMRYPWPRLWWTGSLLLSMVSCSWFKKRTKEQQIKLMLSESGISASPQSLPLTSINSPLAAPLRARQGFIFHAVVGTESAE